MIYLKERIERVYENVNPEKIVFTDKKWNKKIKPLPIIWIILVTPIFGWLYWQNYDWVIPLLTLVWMGLGILGFYAFINTHAKEQLTHLGLKPTKGFFKHWANTAYFEFKLKKFFKKLKEEEILTDTSRDIEIIKDCLVLFDTESKHLFKKGEYILAGSFSILIILIIPVWSEYVSILFEKNKDKTLEVLSFCTIILLTLFLLLAMLAFFKRGLDDYNNRKSNKLKEIARHLETIHINLKIKYSKT
jgi:hypothetical protein